MDYRIEQLRYRLREEPGSRVFYQLGEILRREGSLDESIAVLQRGLEDHPRYVAAWVSFGRALAAAERGTEAERAFARALELDPENSVAARSIGEVAAGRRDWVRAVKAFKLARVLSPGDTSLEARIAEVEARLAEAGQLEVAPPGRSVAPAPPTAPAARPARTPLPVVSVSDDDPFAIAVSIDTGVFVVADDVFLSEMSGDAAPQGSQPAETFPTQEADDDQEPSEDVPAQVEGAPFGDEAEGEVAAAESGWDEDDTSQAEGIAEPDAFEAAVSHEGAGAIEPLAVAPEMAAETEVAAASPFLQEFPEEDEDDTDEYPADELDDERPTDLPLPTMTLARLALQQGDRELAERTVFGVLERDPEHAEARSLLLSLRATRSQPVVTQRVADRTGGRVAALQGWLDTIRLAAENRRR